MTDPVHLIDLPSSFDTDAAWKEAKREVERLKPVTPEVTSALAEINAELKLRVPGYDPMTGVVTKP